MEQLLNATICPPRTKDVTGLGWAVHPEGFAASLQRLAALFPDRDLVVTESGAAYDDPMGGRSIADQDRLGYHAAYIGAVGRAIAAGVPVRGYFAWSLFDNFEWSQGYGPRFGIVGIDYATQRRPVKASGSWYRTVIDANALPIGDDADGRCRRNSRPTMIYRCQQSQK
ncbi:MAG: family 1 glycosylhydrolase [Actinomycetota bacterium]|nr:family 1 glycosylhydrolase [Actinomycetota bacterium]